MVQLMFEGTIAYWFTRPVSPRRWYLIRMCGDLSYCGAWVLAGYVACRAAGAIAGPPSWPAGGAALLTLALGLVIMYYLQVVVDLMCFWSTVNDSAILAVQFASSLLSGAFAPLWYFPGWFQRVNAFLPFQSTLNTPLSLYVGRLPVSSLGPQAASSRWPPAPSQPCCSTSSSVAEAVTTTGLSVMPGTVTRVIDPLAACLLISSVPQAPRDCG